VFEQLTQTELAIIAGGECDCTCLMREGDIVGGVTHGGPDIGVGARHLGTRSDAAVCQAACVSWGWPLSRCTPL